MDEWEKKVWVGENITWEVLENSDEITKKNKWIALSVKLARNTIIQILGLDNLVTSDNFAALIDYIGEERKIINNGEADDYRNSEDYRKAA